MVDMTRQLLKAPVLLSMPLVLLLTSCVGILPMPNFSRTPENGKVIQSEQVSFIRPGLTTRQEVTNRLGCEFRDSPRAPALAYSWEIPGGRGLWWLACMEGGVSGEFEWSYWRAFFVLFDADDVVAETKFVRLGGKKSLDEQLEQWALKVGAKTGFNTKAGGWRSLDKNADRGAAHWRGEP